MATYRAADEPGLTRDRGRTVTQGDVVCKAEAQTHGGGIIR